MLADELTALVPQLVASWVSKSAVYSAFITSMRQCSLLYCISSYHREPDPTSPVDVATNNLYVEEQGGMEGSHHEVSSKQLIPATFHVCLSDAAHASSRIPDIPPPRGIRKSRVLQSSDSAFGPHREEYEVNKPVSKLARFKTAVLADMCIYRNSPN